VLSRRQNQAVSRSQDYSSQDYSSQDYSSQDHSSQDADAFSLSDQEVERFRVDGFLALDGLMPPHEVAMARDTLQRLLDSRIGYKEGSRFDFLSADDDPDKPVMPQILRPSVFAPHLLQGIAIQRAARIAHQLIGPQARLSFDHMIMKPPFSPASTPWHQDDGFADPQYENESISLWIPLQAVDQENGCLCFVPGPSTRVVLPHRSPGDDARIHGLECMSGFDDAAGVPCPIPAGGCTIHSGRTLHGAGPNLSASPRYAFVMVFSTPKHAAKVVQPRPWQLQKQTARSARERGWLRRGGWITHVMRSLSSKRPSDIGRVLNGRLRRTINRTGTRD
jgi:hypothetical protein